MTTADASASDASTSDAAAMPATDTAANATAADTTADAAADSRSTSDSSATNGATTLLLGLVLDEVNLGLGGLGGSGGGDGDVGLFVGFLDQHVDEGLLFVLGLGGDDGRNGRGRSGGLNEDDLVVLLGHTAASDDLGALFFGFWGWDVDVDVLLHYGCATEAASEATAAG